MIKKLINLYKDGRTRPKAIISTVLIVLVLALTAFVAKGSIDYFDDIPVDAGYDNAIVDSSVSSNITNTDSQVSTGDSELIEDPEVSTILSYAQVETKINEFKRSMNSADFDFVKGLQTLESLFTELEQAKTNSIISETNTQMYNALRGALQELTHDMCIKSFTMSYDNLIEKEYIDITCNEMGKTSGIDSKVTYIDTTEKRSVTVAGDTVVRCENTYYEQCKTDLSDYKSGNKNSFDREFEFVYETIIKDILSVGKEQVTYSNGVFEIKFSEIYTCQFTVNASGMLDRLTLKTVEQQDGKDKTTVIDYIFVVIKKEVFDGKYEDVSVVIEEAAYYYRPENFLPR